MENYATLTEAIEGLRKAGYTIDFNLKENCLECTNGVHRVLPDEFHIDQTWRFDVDTDPADQSILYAISSEKHNIKGILVNAYGIYSDAVTNEMLEKLR